MPVASISVPRNSGCRVSRSLSLARADGSPAAARTAPPTVIALVFRSTFLTARLAALKARLRANAGQAVECEQGVVDRPEQRHGVERLDALHCRDAFRGDRGRQLGNPVQALGATAAPDRRRPGR